MMNLDYDSLLQQHSSQKPTHQQQASNSDNPCSFLFLQKQSLSSTCSPGFDDCREANVWCWSQSCSFNSHDVHSCAINGTTHLCICSSLPPTLQLEIDDTITSTSTSTSAIFTDAPVSDFNSTWLASTKTTPFTSTTMSTWDSDQGAFDGRSDFRQSLQEPSSSSLPTNQTENDGLPGGAIAAIVVVSFLLAVALIALSVWSVLKLKRKRKLEGKYCPAVEEQKSSANTLPPLPLPAPEGLI